MNGKGPICLRLQNHSFHEHDSLESARREAHRLADATQAAVVVYVPVLIVRPPQRTVEAYLITRDQLDHMERITDDDLPF